MSLKLIDIFAFCKKELIVHILSFQVKAIYNYSGWPKNLEFDNLGKKKPGI